MIIENLGNLTLRINGPDVEEYANYDYSLDEIPYDAAVSFHFITKINSDLTAELLDGKSPYEIIIHNTGEEIQDRNIDSFEVTVPEDGYYEITTLIIPTIDYVDGVLGYSPGSIVKENLNKNIIAVEIKDNKVCLKILEHALDLESGLNAHIWTGWKCISLPEVLTMLELAENRDYYDSEETNVKKFSASAFIYDNLYNCYIKRSTELISKYVGDSGFCGTNSMCDDSLKKYKSEIQIRDYLWMAINVIKYCIQNCQYLKALKILGCVSSCDGICSDIKTTKLKTKKIGGCGCGK